MLRASIPIPAWLLLVFLIRTPQNTSSFSTRRQSALLISSSSSFSSISSSNSALFVGAQERRKAESLESGHHPLISLNLNLDSLAQGGASKRAQELLQRIEALHEEGYYAVSPDSVSYNSVLKAWVKYNSPEKALELLQRMEEKQELYETLHSGGGGNNVDDNNIKSGGVLNVISYNTVINAFAQNGRYLEAEQLLQRMQDQGRIVPNTVTFNSVLNAYSQSTDEDAPPKAEALLRKMTILDDIQVDTTSFNTVLHAYAKSKESSAPLRAQELLRHMETLALAGNAKVRPDVYSYTTVIQAWVAQLRHRYRRRESKSRGSHFDRGAPGASSSTSSGKETDAARAAKKLLEKMEEQKLQPNQVTYTSVMTALCWSGRPQDAHELLLNLLKRFEQQQAMVEESPSASSMLVKPDTITFSAVMDGWVKNAVTFPEAATKVMELLEIMKHWQALGHADMGPNSRTYTSVISALAKSRTWDACLRAKNLLAEIPDGGATVIHYNAVLDAFAKSPRADKAQLAKRVLEELMESPSLEPDLISFNTVISACAASFGDPELKKNSLTIATSVFNHICRSDDLHPSPYTFSVMIKALRKLTTREDVRNDLISKIFQICCKHGCLNAGVWQQVKNSIPFSDSTAILWKELLGGNLVNNDGGSDIPCLHLSDLPKEWKRNANKY